MNDNAQPSAAKVSARRRLLRGAFSAPAVLTIYSGGALASASSQRCLLYQNQAGNVLASPAVSASADTYLRVQLFTDGASTPKYYVVGTSLPVSRAAALPTNSQAQQFDVGAANTFIGSPVATPGGLNLTGKYAALRVDSAGVCVGVGKSTTSGTAIFNSCWTSFIVGP